MVTLINVYLLAIAAYNFVTVSGNVYFPATKPNNNWWSNTIIYQIYPRSFKDSDNDGIGDLQGIIKKLDHFVDLGVETLWIGPIFKSPMDDMGYDVEDFKEIDPIFGTMDDFDELISEMNKRNLKFITDLVPNHSSYKCDWFQKSIKREGKYTDYYLWHNALNQDEIINNPNITPKPPNNWLSIFGGSGWTWNNERKQFYFHQFSSKQPDFNIRNQLVHEELNSIMAFWMDKGIAGFRIDALTHLYEAASLEDEPYIAGFEGSNKFEHMNHIYTLNQPESIEIVKEWRTFIDNYTKSSNYSLSRLITTESYSSIETILKYYGNSTNPGADLPFNFGLLGVDRTDLVNWIDTAISEWLNKMPKNRVANWVTENHDNPRTSSKYGPEMVPLFTALKLALPGVEVTYYGSEIGMENTYVRPDQIQDPNNAGGIRTDESRDYERCPMQWDDSINAGFNDGKKPWLPINPNYYKLNVEAQKKTPTSNYNFYKKMSQLRKTDTLKYGDLQTYNISSSLYIIKRSLLGHESYVVVCNFGSETNTIKLPNIIQKLDDTLYVYLGSVNSAYSEGNIISKSSSDDHPLILRPQSVVVLTDKYIAAESGSSKIGSNLNISFCTILLVIYFWIS